MHTFAVIHRVTHPAFANEVPYIVAVIELDEGPRMLSNVIALDPDNIYCGMRVAVRFNDLTPDISLPVFSPCEPNAD